jgi:hypothetical protein
MYLKNFFEIWKHKWFVFCAGLKTRAPLWQLLWHDMSKFSPSEFPHYARKFHGGDTDPMGFGLAWLHHENANPHHWGYWIPRSGRYTNKPLEMPERYVREMVADWLGASRSYEGEWPVSITTWNWFMNSFAGIVMHENTQVRVLEILELSGVEIDVETNSRQIR